MITIACSGVLSDDASTLKPLIKSGQIHEKALNIFGTRALSTLLFGFVACHERKIYLFIYSDTFLFSFFFCLPDDKFCESDTIYGSLSRQLMKELNTYYTLCLCQCLFCIQNTFSLLFFFKLLEKETFLLKPA